MRESIIGIDPGPREFAWVLWDGRDDDTEEEPDGEELDAAGMLPRVGRIYDFYCSG